LSGDWNCADLCPLEGEKTMTMNSIRSSVSEETQDDELPETNIDEHRAPPVNIGNSREAVDGVAEGDPKAGLSNATTCIPPPQSANQE
jgi:hypothetical protein